MKEIIQTKAVRKSIGLGKHMKPTPQKWYLESFFSSAIFAHLSTSLINISAEKFPWNKPDKIPTFTGISPRVTILTMLEAISTSQDSMADEVLGNIVAELIKRGNFGGFDDDSMQSLIEVMWNKVEYDLKDSLKAAGKLEEFSD